MKKWLQTFWFDIGFVVLIFMIWAYLSSESFGPLSAHHKNEKGIAALTAEMFNLAEKNFLDVLKHNILNPVGRLNLGNTYEISQKHDRAYKEYTSLLRINNLKSEHIFFGHFNAGNASVGEQKIDQALMHYQAALDVSPENDDVRKNIELLFKGQQGQGKGSGNNKSDKKENGEDQGGDPKQDPRDNPNSQLNQEDQTQDEFKGKELSKEDVRKILEELKSQEQKIRALDYSGKKGKEKSPDKDW